MESLAFVGRKNGLCNRLEMLMAAYAIRRRHGHSVMVDWPEMPFMKLPTVKAGKPAWWRRLGSHRVLRDQCELEPLGRLRTIDIRGVSSVPDALIEREIQAYGSKIGPDPKLAQTMTERLTSLEGRVVVGVHVRQGDFLPASEDAYRAIDGHHTRVPIWWYEHVMNRIEAEARDVTFLMCVNGERAPFQPLLDRFNCIVCDFPFDFELPRAGHQSESNPVADLFALAACSLILGTPASSFSHWAASNLGPPSTVASPALAMTRAAPACRLSSLRHKPLGDWVDFSWRGVNQDAMTSWEAAVPKIKFDSAWWLATEDSTT